jgi:hypothetical protein
MTSSLARAGPDGVAPAKFEPLRCDRAAQEKPMSFERMPGPMGAEPAPPSTAAENGGREPSPVALRLQVLATEHWGLLATRSLAWNESFTRAGMFLSALSGAIVALALVAQATTFGGEFRLFALVILPVVLFIGVTTFVRIGRSNDYDAMCVVGMNRIRHAYLEITPEVEPYLVMAAHDDPASVGRSMGMRPGTNILVDILVSTPFVLATINAVIGGAISGLVARSFGTATGTAVAIAIVIGLGILIVEMVGASRAIASEIASLAPKFPAPGPASEPDDAAEG